METLFAAVLVLAAPSADLEKDLAAKPGIVDAAKVVPDLQVELAYATNENFIGKNVYGSLSKCFLQESAAEMLAKAYAFLQKRAPGYRFHVYDCLRPRRVQLQMWEVVKGTPQQGYVANPHTKTGSIHNYGCAIDMTLADPNGTPIDMGTGFDHFGDEAQPRFESKYLTSRTLSHEALANRLLLREVMVRAGFYVLANEWWHFNCTTNAGARKRYKIVE